MERDGMGWDGIKEYQREHEKEKMKNGGGGK